METGCLLNLVIARTIRKLSEELVSFVVRPLLEYKSSDYDQKMGEDV